jgi:hypothetical protein
VYRHFAGLALSAGIAALALGGTAQARVVFSENFERETIGSVITNFAQFNVTQGSVNVVPAVPPFDFFPAGNYVDLFGSAPDREPPGQITTKMSFAPGTYVLNFNLGAHPRGRNNTLRVALGDFSQDITLGAAAGLTSQSFTFDTIGGSLSFTNLGNGFHRSLTLDNVQLSNAIPEPSTWAMMLIGFAGLAFASQRKRAMVAA